MKILIIEDNQSVREELNTLLSLEGIEVIEAENGYLGFEMAKESPPDLIISDIVMPNMDGFDFLHEIKNYPLTSEIPFFILSALTSTSAHIKGLSADEYIDKPYNSEDLIEKIKCYSKK
jgi:two-component system sensor histidine kinase/response regulator